VIYLLAWFTTYTGPARVLLTRFTYHQYVLLFCITPRYAPWAAASQVAASALEQLASRFPQFVFAALDVEATQENEALAWEKV
jgi:hypothetical protein